MLSSLVKYCLVIVYSICILIDDSTDQVYQEEECYQDEEEENFNHYTNQGKLALSKINPCKLYLQSTINNAS